LSGCLYVFYKLALLEVLELAFFSVGEEVPNGVLPSMICIASL